MSNNGPLFDHPPCSNDTTSREAAEAIAPKAKGLRAMVLLYLKRSPDGSTAQDIEQGLDLSGNTVRPRLRELMQAGRVYDSGETRRLASGRKAIIWRAR